MGRIKKDLREFASDVSSSMKLKRPTARTVSYNLQKARFVDPSYKIKIPYPMMKKKKGRRKHPAYIIRGGKAYLLR